MSSEIPPRAPSRKVAVGPQLTAGNAYDAAHSPHSLEPMPFTHRSRPNVSPSYGPSGPGFDDIDADGPDAHNNDVYISTPPTRPHLSAKATEANVAPENVRLGIACMHKKMKSPTMQAFISRFASLGKFEVVQFSESMILDSPVEEWPNVDCAIMFFSAGFPLPKACAYYRIHRRDTFFLTEPPSQVVLLDRRDFYRAMNHNNIPLPPNHAFCSRDGYRNEPDNVLEEFDDYIIIDDKRIDKPFVEKPVDAEDHDVFIYYPKSMGGGCRKMFRKVKNTSSCFDPDHNRVRRDGSFLYESFVQAAGSCDIKCYTVGPEFVHAEARKAPTVDGVVDRDDKGKEIRETVQLHPAELMVARKITKVFRQMVCGFDLLRVSDTEFYVCDVNGWSFVKNNQAYVERAVGIMADIFLAEVGRRGLHRVFKRTASVRELVGVVGVFRHADRTPKQKLKLTITSPRIIGVAFSGVDNVREEVVLKGENQKIDILEQAIREELEALRAESASGDAQGVTPADSPTSAASPTRDKRPSNRKQREVYERMLDVTSRRHEGLKLQVKPKKFSDDGACCEAQLVCKWGGWLTLAGEQQAATVGTHFVDRVFGNECGPNYLRDVGVSSNNERRVMNTARLFVDSVTTPGERSVEVNERLLGDNSFAKDHLEEMQDEVSRIMHVSSVDEANELRKSVPDIATILDHFMLSDGDRTPLAAMRYLHRLMVELVDHVKHRWASDDYRLYRDEPLGLFKQRWSNLMGSFVVDPIAPQYDVSKLTDIFDYASYDVCYNQRAFNPVDLYPLFTLSQTLSAFVSEAESGCTREQQLTTGSLIGELLITRIYDDLMRMAVHEGPRTALYFTSASHVNALRQILYNCDAAEFHNVGSPLELHFLSHFVFKVYRYPQRSTSATPSHRGTPGSGVPAAAAAAPSVSGDDVTGASLQTNGSHPSSVSAEAERSGHVPPLTMSSPTSSDVPTYQIEVHFSTGVDKNMFGIVQDHHVQYGAVLPMIRIHNNLTFMKFYNIVKQCQVVFSRVTGEHCEPTTLPRGLMTPVANRSGTATPLTSHRGEFATPNSALPRGDFPAPSPLASGGPASATDDSLVAS